METIFEYNFDAFLEFDPLNDHKFHFNFDKERESVINDWMNLGVEIHKYRRAFNK